MLEEKDIKKLKELLKPFATKEDLKSFAKKDDLKFFATKEDLKPFATKEDLRFFATKDDLKPFATKEDLRPLATKKDLEQEIEGLAAMVNRSFNENEKRMTDGFSMVLDEFKAVNGKLDKKVKNIDERMSKLEEALAVK